MARIQKLRLAKAADVPNNTLPVLIIRGALSLGAAEKRPAFASGSGRTAGADCGPTIYDYTHFHSNAHEVLGIAEGKAALWIGEEGGSLFRLKAGDMIVLPAGVGHRRVGGDDDLKVIGAYPRGQSHYDMKREGKRVPKVALPKTDPFFGVGRPLVKAWRKRSRKQLGRKG